MGDAGSPSVASSAGMANKSTSSTVWLPVKEDVIPPKGIVNSAQLEKELMRMFANAVMFNPDPKRGVGPAFRTQRQEKSEAQAETGEGDNEEEGGVVHDTREMCRDVERRVAEWRAA